MKLTIVPPVNYVSVNGEQRHVDCAKFASLVGIHAIHWHDTRGHIEYVKPYGANPENPIPNEQITSIDKFKEVIDAWGVAAAPAPTGRRE